MDFEALIIGSMLYQSIGIGFEVGYTVDVIPGNFDRLPDTFCWRNRNGLLEGVHLLQNTYFTTQDNG